jgi:hypothetical protein
VTTDPRQQRLRSLRIWRALTGLLVIFSGVLVAVYGLSFVRGLVLFGNVSVFVTFALLVRDSRAPS